MTTGTNLDERGELRDWAQGELGIDSLAPIAEARRRVLSDLGEFDFVPPESWQFALRALGLGGEPWNSQVTPPSVVLRAREDERRAEVEEFAARFFSLPVADRRLRWSDLARRCTPWPALTARLRDLAPGVEIEVPPESLVGHLGELRQEILSLFVLKRGQRAPRRQEFLARCDRDLAGWEIALRQLKKTAPAIAGLEPALVGQLATWRKRDEARCRFIRRRPRKMVTTSAKRGSSIPWWAYLFIAGGLFKGIAGFTDRPKPSYQPPAPPTFRYSPNNDSQHAIDKMVREMIERDPDSVGEPLRRLYGLPPRSNPAETGPPIPQSTPPAPQIPDEGAWERLDALPEVEPSAP